MGNDFYLDEELRELFGLRNDGKPCDVLFEPKELGWLCPVDEEHRITWSEFKQHIWCFDCAKDYFSLLCPKRMNPETVDFILKAETARISPLMQEWTIEKYRALGKSLGGDWLKV